MPCGTAAVDRKVFSQRQAKEPLPRAGFSLVTKRDLGVSGVVSAGRNYRKPGRRHRPGMPLPNLPTPGPFCPDTSGISLAEGRLASCRHVLAAFVWCRETTHRY